MVDQAQGKPQREGQLCGEQDVVLQFSLGGVSGLPHHHGEADPRAGHGQRPSQRPLKRVEHRAPERLAGDQTGGTPNQGVDDPRVLAQAREILRRVPLAERIYARLQRDGLGDRVADFVISEASGDYANL
ncbi:MAG: hypothetical protein B7733_00925, partial [Myxococcales bacterium FL481]